MKTTTITTTKTTSSGDILGVDDSGDLEQYLHGSVHIESDDDFDGR